MATQIKLRRDTSTNWTTLNPTLALGEPGYETNTGKLKIGNGVSNWQTLPYFNTQQPDLTAFAGHIIPSADNTYDLGSPTKQWRHAYIANGSLYIGDIKLSNNNGQLVVQQVTDAGLVTETPVPDTPGAVTTDRLINGANIATLASDGALNLSSNGAGLKWSNPETPPQPIGGWLANSTIAFDKDLGIVLSNGVGGSGGYSWILSKDGKLKLPLGGDIVDSNGISVLGGGNANTGNINFVNDDIYNFNGITLENADLTHGATSAVIIPANGSNGTLQINNTYGPVSITSGITGATQQWEFRGDGVLRSSNSFTKTSMTGITTTSPTVVWTASEDFISGVKLLIQVESFENGDNTGWHSQVCEAIIASRGYANSFGGPGGDPVMTVYGVTHTSTVPLVTFTVQRNPTTKFIEVVGTLTAAVNPVSADLRIYSVETATRD